MRLGPALARGGRQASMVLCGRSQVARSQMRGGWSVVMEGGCVVANMGQEWCGTVQL